MKLLKEMDNNLKEFKLNNKFNRKELINDLKFEILENYSKNHEKIALLEAEIKRVNQKCDLFNAFIKDKV